MTIYTACISAKKKSSIFVRKAKNLKIENFNFFNRKSNFSVEKKFQQALQLGSFLQKRCFTQGISSILEAGWRGVNANQTKVSFIVLKNLSDSGSDKLSKGKYFADGSPKLVVDRKRLQDEPNTGVMCSQHLAPVRRVAPTFCTYWSFQGHIKYRSEYSRVF